MSHNQTLSTAVGYFYDNEIVCADNEKVTMIWTWSIVCLLWHPQISAQILPCAPPWPPGRVLGSIIPGNHDACLWPGPGHPATCSAVPSSPPSSVIMMIHHNWVCLSFKSPPPPHYIMLATLCHSKPPQGSLCVAGPHVVAPKSPPVVLWFVITWYPNSRLPWTNSRPTHNWRGFGRH